MRVSVASACATAAPAIIRDSCTWRLISLTEAASSSEADATDCTLADASSDAAATAIDSDCVVSAVRVNVLADTSSSVEADDTVATIVPIAASNLSAS